MSGDGKTRKRNLLSGGPKTAINNQKTTSNTSVNTDSLLSRPTVCDTSSSLSSKNEPTPIERRQTRLSSTQQSTLPFAFTQTRPKTTIKLPITKEEDNDDDDDDIQIIEEPQPKRRNCGIPKKEPSNEPAKVLAPESLAIPFERQDEQRQGTPFLKIQNRNKNHHREIVPDSIAEVDEIEDDSSLQRSLIKRTQNQAGLDDGLGETLRAVKQIKLSSSSNDVKMIATIRTKIPGKRFKKAPQGSAFSGRESQRISISQMSTWTGSTT